MSRQEAEAERLRVRDQTVAWRAWYKTARWQKLRQAVLLRDAYTCQKSGIICMGKHPDDNSPVAHHIVAHRGDEALFWDIDNIQTVSKAWHDGPGQAEERNEGLRW
ncbi:MAG: endonuclease [Rhizobium sp.]|nr:endonuclease [Rhizobium sp.]